MRRILVSIVLRFGGLVLGLAMLIAPRTTLRLLQRELKAVIAAKLLEAVLEQPHAHACELEPPSVRKP